MKLLYLISAYRPVNSHVVTGPGDPQIPPDSESTHILTGVDKLHAQGITGKGIKIGMYGVRFSLNRSHDLLLLFSL